MTHDEKIKKIKKCFMDFFFKETGEGYNANVIDSREHLGINLLSEHYAEKVLFQLNALYSPKIDINKLAKVLKKYPLPDNFNPMGIAHAIAQNKEWIK